MMLATFVAGGAQLASNFPKTSRRTPPESILTSGQLNIADLFQGFDFVNQRRYVTLTIPPPSGLRHSRTASRHFPGRFVAGWQYIFHHRGSHTTDELYGLLERKLHDSGLEVDVIGSVSGERVHPSAILFNGGGYVGSVSLYPTHFSQCIADTQQGKRWDIILFINKSPEWMNAAPNSIGVVFDTEPGAVATGSKTQRAG
ncbi:MAG: hypothetical protein QOI77_510 [Blastocatellia bacterium]|nr:hypothetical protein [Blastocatellia bacterium]